MAVAFGFRKGLSIWLMRKETVFLSLFILSMVMLMGAGGLFLVILNKNQKVEAGLVQMVGTEIVTESSKTAPTTEPLLFASEALFVDISGAVVSPGVYQLPLLNGQKPRFWQVLELAGGFSSQVNRDYIKTHINLAQIVNDGQKFYIPYEFETCLDGNGHVSSQNGTNGEQTIGNKVSVNTATEKELQTLKGVGEARSATIVRNRPYESLDELIIKKAITQKILDDNYDLISL